MVLVKNVHGSSRHSKPRRHESWIAYWEYNSSSTGQYYCSARDCNNANEAGAHVLKVNNPDRKQYIVPLCKACNQRTDNFWVPANSLVPVPSNL